MREFASTHPCSANSRRASICRPMPGTAPTPRKSATGHSRRWITRSIPPPARCACAPISTIATNQLFPNQFVNVRLLVEQKTRRGSGQQRRDPAELPVSTYVYVVNADNKVTVRQVTEGVTEGDYTEITSGLNPGDVMVMTGVDKLAEGTPCHRSMADDQAAAKSTNSPAGAAPRRPNPEGRRSESVPDVYSPAGRDVPADGWHPAGRRRGLQAACPSPLCPRWITRPSRSSPSIPAPAPT